MRKRLANEIGGFSEEIEQMDVDARDSREVRLFLLPFLAAELTRWAEVIRHRESNAKKLRSVTEFNHWLEMSARVTRRESAMAAQILVAAEARLRQRGLLLITAADREVLVPHLRAHKASRSTASNIEKAQWCANS